ncbi:hypothetical protein QN412_03000 [Pseudomonas sp. RTB3]|uniref:hypothetical protein n=1 Tax=unclassified Pseudomonas TaxID=196821 RepID=UPI002B227988|nr:MULTISPECIES: hypothetical protein [unclassified Pseudomonas]MEB0008642.1 hypothetical protein [Pseudomonas sp. RTB2]MEB0015922.1 hypothetical protein [Pseudomonas sp. RTB3]MEB0270864.1 hypothetical protein [Pseudomonas sp. 5B4]
MKLIGARQAWTDSQHESNASISAVAIETAKIGIKKSKARIQRRESFFPAMGNEENEKAGCFPVLGQRISISETRRTPAGRSTARAAHLTMMGKIQRAISTLPFQVQQFGHYMYSPIPNMRYVMNAMLLISTKADLSELTPLKRARAQYLVTAALQSFKSEVTGAPEWGPARVTEEMREFFGLSIDPNNWNRDWKPAWEILKATIKDVDMDAQSPVWQVIHVENEDGAA